MRHEFVEHIPDELAEGVLYVSVAFGTVVHRCACGCGEEVVTPLGPAEWQLSYDGRTVSLTPSIGNWSFKCRSHYWIDDGRVRWARSFSKQEVAIVRGKARSRRDGYYAGDRDAPVAGPEDDSDDQARDERATRVRRFRATWAWLRSLGRAD